MKSVYVYAGKYEEWPIDSKQKMKRRFLSIPVIYMDIGNLQNKKNKKLPKMSEPWYPTPPPQKKIINLATFMITKF